MRPAVQSRASTTDEARVPGQGRSAFLVRPLALLIAASAVWLALTAASVLTLNQAMAASAAVPPPATDAGHPCPAGAPTKTFAVSLINIPLFLNRFGDVIPEGRMYVLNENIAAARATFARAADPFNPKDIIQPLVFRVNSGDCVEVSFTNRLNEPAPAFNRDASIFILPGETLRAPGTVTPQPREFAPAATRPDIDFDPAKAPAASMHFTGLVYDVQGSDGTAAGNNPNSTVQAGDTILYRLFADQEGNFPFQDGADLTGPANAAGNFIGSSVFGAFGGINVEPPGTTFLDINTGEPLKSGISAIIADPTGPDFREHSLFMHDELEAEPGILTRFCVPAKSPAPPAGSECVNPTKTQLKKLQAGTLPGLGGGDADVLINGEIPTKVEWFAFNYRAEPGFNREEVGCPALQAPFQARACVGEETGLSSWPFGDPGGGDLVIRNYRGEPMQIRLFHGAGAETHTFHWHVNRWPFDPADEGGLAQITSPTHHTRTTNPLDVQAVSPGAHYPLIPEGGAGSAHDDKPATFGDIIFHCHLYPHFTHGGMWGLNRVHDVLETGVNADGSPRRNPDTTPIPPLARLPDRVPPPAPTAQTPGFPFFVPGVFGFKGPKPPLGVPQRQAGGAFPPTALETNAAEPNAQKPGAFFVDPCPPTRADGAPTPLKLFEVAAIQLKKVYSPDLNWNNPQQRVYVLQADKQAVLSGAKEPEPLSPLLNVGDCVEYRLTNELPVQFGGTVFDRLQETNEVSIHQHMVQFDVLSSDGAANGWNYDQGADPSQTIIFRDFVSHDVRTNSFHDHLFPNIHQDSGLFGGSTIHPAGCTFHDPNTGAPVNVGTIVDVHCVPATDYHGNPTTGENARSVALFIEDQVPMFQPEDPNNPNDDQFVTPFGVPIFPAKFPSSNDDRGVMGVNYRLEPFEARRASDPANLFSSEVWGDPFTPLPRAFVGDNVKIRLFQLSMEESHGFNLHRFRWNFEPDDPQSNIVQAQHIGMLEYFELRVPVTAEAKNRRGQDERDYLYYYGGADDWFLGSWGIFRVFGCDNRQLQPLPDNPLQGCSGPGAPEPSSPTGPPRVPGDPCPTDMSGQITVPVIQYSVIAINNDIVFNTAGEHDPNGVMYVLQADLAAIQNGTKQPQPLVIRASAGDCVEVTLTNQLDPAKMKPHCFEAIEPGQLGFIDNPRSSQLTLPKCLQQPPQDEVNVPGFQPFPVSARVSINPKLVDYHIGSDGANVGFNVDSTVGPGESILYRWFAPEEVGLGVLHDRADVQNHLHHGLYGGLVVEPAGSSFLSPKDGAPLASGQEAVITHPTRPDFRESIVTMNSDLSLFRTNAFPVPDNNDLVLGPSHVEDDPEDQGEFSINYRNEPWVHRFLRNPDLSLVFSSVVHGDPATPVFRAYTGDPARFRVSQAVGDARSTMFVLHGHRWRRSPNDPQSEIAATQGQFNPSVTFSIQLDPGVFGGAGNGFDGDYLYRSNTLFRHLTGGQWGLFRVHGARQPDVIVLPDRPPPP